ncbi:MAG: PIN domain-containing protein [Bacteroidales bacterium]
MQDKVFVDSNIWLYAFMDGVSPKKQIAVELVTKNDVVLNTQVVNEICVNLIKKANYSDLDVLTLLRNLKDNHDISELYFNTLILGTELRIKYKTSIWDSLIIASALQNNCAILYTEDMQHNQVIENSLTIINPFL